MVLVCLIRHVNHENMCICLVPLGGQYNHSQGTIQTCTHSNDGKVPIFSLLSACMQKIWVSIVKQTKLDKKCETIVLSSTEGMIRYL